MDVLGAGVIYGKFDDQGVMISSCNEYDLEFQAWLAAGNTPDPQDPPPPPPDPSTIPPSVEERLQAAETLINLILDEEGE